MGFEMGHEGHTGVGEDSVSGGVSWWANVRRQAGGSVNSTQDHAASECGVQ